MGLKLIDYLVPGPAILLILCGISVLITTYSLWLLNAQRHWRKHLVQAGEIGQRSPHNSEQKADKWQPSVDIFVAAKNEARVIEHCVRSLFQLDYPTLGLYVIDDQSADATPEILTRLSREFPRLQVISRRPGSYPGKSAALNEALAVSTAEVITVFDADAHIEADFLKQTLPVLAPDTVGAVQARKRIYQHQKGFLPEAQASEYALDTYFQVGRDLVGGAVELRGNGQLIKRQALIDVGGWNGKAITDDLDLSMRLLISNWRVRFCPHAWVWEEAVTDLKGLMRQRRRWAEGSIRRYLDYIFPLNSPRRLSLRQRIDTLMFTVFFSVPALMLLEVISEAAYLATGQPTHGRFLCGVATVLILIAMANLFTAVRLYRQLPLARAIVHTVEVNAYIFAHWVPCVLISISQIVFRNGASRWHPTEHRGHSPSVGI